MSAEPSAASQIHFNPWEMKPGILIITSIKTKVYAVNVISQVNHIYIVMQNTSINNNKPELYTMNSQGFSAGIKTGYNKRTRGTCTTSVWHLIVSHTDNFLLLQFLRSDPVKMSLHSELDTIMQFLFPPILNQIHVKQPQNI